MILAKGLFLELRTLRGEIGSIDRRYLDSHEALFPESSEGFKELLGMVDKRLVPTTNSWRRDLRAMESYLVGQPAKKGTNG